jgi:hypothetical protein
MTIAALPIYLLLFPVTILMPVIIHFVNLILIIFVLVKNWRNSLPLVIIVGGFFYAVYIQTFIISVAPEYGVDDPFHELYDVWVALFIIAIDIVIAFIIKKISGKWF